MSIKLPSAVTLDAANERRHAIAKRDPGLERSSNWRV